GLPLGHERASFHRLSLYGRHPGPMVGIRLGRGQRALAAQTDRGTRHRLNLSQPCRRGCRPATFSLPFAASPADRESVMTLMARLLAPRLLNLFAFLACVVAMAGALYLEHFKGLDPCPLCIFQRV